MKTFKITGRIEKSAVRGHRTAKITAESGQIIEILIEFSSSITLESIKRILFTVTQCDVSITTISSYLKSLKITLKRINLVLERVKDTERLEIRKVFATDFFSNASIDDAKKFFVDKFEFNLHLRRKYGRSIRGTRVSIEVPTVRGKNVTLLSAMNGNSIVYYKIFLGSCKGGVSLRFLTELDHLIVERFKFRDAVIYMDNCSAHRSVVTRAAMNQLTNGTKFLSPYSYMLNPIEFAFGKIKTFVRNNLESRNQSLNEIIHRAILEIAEQDCN